MFCSDNGKKKICSNILLLMVKRTPYFCGSEKYMKSLCAHFPVNVNQLYAQRTLCPGLSEKRTIKYFHLLFTRLQILNIHYLPEDSKRVRGIRFVIFSYNWIKLFTFQDNFCCDVYSWIQFPDFLHSLLPQKRHFTHIKFQMENTHWSGF